MAIDLSMFDNLLKPPKSIADYDAEAQASQANALNVQLGRQKVQRGQFEADQTQRGMADDAALRSALSALAPGAGYKERIGALEGTRLPGGFAAADAMRKAQAALEKDEAAAAKDNTQAKGYTLDQRIKAAEYHAQQVGTLEDPLEAAQWMASGKRDGVFDDEQVARGMAALRQMQNPQQFEEWKARARAGGVSATEQLKAEARAKEQAEQARQFGVTSGETQRHNKVSEGISGGNLAVAQGNLGVARERLGLDKGGGVGGLAGKPLPGPVLKQLTEARDNAATISGLKESFKADFAGKGVLGIGGDAQLAVSGNVGADRDAVEWWKNYRKQAELVERHALFGAALTPTEQSSWRSADIGPGMDAKVVAKNLETRETLAKKVFENTQQDLVDAGHSSSRVGAIAGRNAQTAPTKPANATGKTVKRTGTSNGRKVVEYSDGSIEYAD